MRFLLILLIPCLIGCGQLLNSIKQTRTVDEKHQGESQAKVEGEVKVNYPEPTQFIPTASGNSSIVINVGGPKGTVFTSKKEAKSAEESHSDSFSVDEFISSVPAWAWPVLIFSIIVLMGAYWWISKTTAAGRALDNLIAGGINLAQKQIANIKDELIHTKPDTEEHKALSRMLERSEKDLSEKRKKERPGASRRISDSLD